MLRRTTHQQQIVYDSLEALGHATSEELIAYINENCSDISLATIYRNLTKLIEDEKIKKLKLGEIDVYETIKEKHYHFHCRACGKTHDINPSIIPLDLKSFNRIKTGIVEDYDMVLYGICNYCKK